MDPIAYLFQTVRISLFGFKLKTTLLYLGLGLGVFNFVQTLIFSGFFHSMARRKRSPIRTIISGPIVEEIIFRLAAIPILITLTGSPAIAVFISAFCFGLGHIFHNPTHFINTFITGLIWGYVFLYLGVIPTIIAHMTHNFLAVVIWR